MHRRQLAHFGFNSLPPDHIWTQRLVQRAESAGYRALVITVDASRNGNKERIARQNFHLPPYKANFGNEPVGNNFTSLPTWDSLVWLRSLTALPLILKGILTAEHGMYGMIVSNHGGRQLDAVPATLEVLPEIVEAVDGRCDVYLDSGIRRGTNVLKALALGARAVFVGRPILWGLVVDGEQGVARVLELLRAELERAMVLAGCPILSNIDRSLIRGSVKANE